MHVVLREAYRGVWRIAGGQVMLCNITGCSGLIDFQVISNYYAACRSVFLHQESIVEGVCACSAVVEKNIFFVSMIFACNLVKKLIYLAHHVHCIS